MWGEFCILVRKCQENKVRDLWAHFLQNKELFSNVFCIPPGVADRSEFTSLLVVDSQLGLYEKHVSPHAAHHCDCIQLEILRTSFMWPWLSEYKLSEALNGVGYWLRLEFAFFISSFSQVPLPLELWHQKVCCKTVCPRNGCLNKTKTIAMSMNVNMEGVPGLDTELQAITYLLLGEGKSVSQEWGPPYWFCPMQSGQPYLHHQTII